MLWPFTFRSLVLQAQQADNLKPIKRMSQITQENPLKGKLFALMVLRVLFAVVFLGVTAWYQNRASILLTQEFNPLYVIVGLISISTIAFALLINKITNLTLFTYVQLSIDILVISLLVYMTGGVDSYLSILFFLTIIAGSIFFGNNGGAFSALLSIFAYITVLVVDYNNYFGNKYQLFGSNVQHAWEDVVITVLINTLGFLIVAFLTGYITEKSYRVEKELEEKEGEFERLELLNSLIVENISSGIVTLNGDSRVTSFNRAAVGITGFTLEDVYFKKFDKIFPDFSIVDSIKKNRNEVTIRSKDNREILVGYVVSHGHSADVSTIIIFSDLTRLKQMEDQLKRDERLTYLGELSASIAHEIRNPLASINGSIQVLQSSLDLRGENEKLMEIVLREIDRLNTLIEDFLLFARPARVNKVKLNLLNVINETLGVFKNSPEARGVNVVNNVKEDCFLFCDERQISQVFWNLFLNAGQAMNGRDNNKILKVGVSFNEDQSNVIVTIEDNGTGVDDEIKSRIFDPFYSTKDRGTGMGLALVHRIVESHNGSILVSDGGMGGTVFILELPVANI